MDSFPSPYPYPGSAGFGAVRRRRTLLDCSASVVRSNTSVTTVVRLDSARSVFDTYDVSTDKLTLRERELCDDKWSFSFDFTGRHGELEIISSKRFGSWIGVVEFHPFDPASGCWLDWWIHTDNQSFKGFQHTNQLERPARLL